MAIKRAVILLLAFAFCGCAEMTIERGDSARPGEAHEYSANALFYGIWRYKKLPTEEQACPRGGIYSMDFRMSFGDMALTAVTLGIYVPHRAVYTCAKAP